MAQTLQEITTLKERRLRWITALESGRFNQSLGTLKDDNGYCCLGVACAISGTGHFKQSFWVDTNFHEFVSNKTSASNNLFKFPHILKLLQMTKKQHSLTVSLNDGIKTFYDNKTFYKKHTFKEIATIFRKVWRLPKP